MINEVEANDINMKPFKVKKTLNKDFFDDKSKMNSQIRMRLLDIADDFIKTLEVKWVKPLDIVVTGSIVNYNWSEFSDVDVHVIYDYSKIYKKHDFVQDYFMSKRDNWNKSHTNLTIKDFPVEMSVEDTNTPLQSSGIYSLEKNDWVREPKEMDDSSMDIKGIQKYCAKQMTKMDELFKKMDKEKDRKKLENLADELEKTLDDVHDKRLSGLKTTEKELSNGNIMWKVVKHMGYADKVHDYLNKVYDRRNTIDEHRKTIYISESQARLLNEQWINGNLYKHFNNYFKDFSGILGFKVTAKDGQILHKIFEPFYNGRVIPQERVNGLYMDSQAITVINTPEFRRRLKEAFSTPKQTPTNKVSKPKPIQTQLFGKEKFEEPEDDSVKMPNDTYMPATDMQRFIDTDDVSTLNEAALETFSLQKLQEIKSFNGRLNYCKQQLGPTFGSGSSRVVFEIDDDKILKLAKNQKGIAQNEAEEDTSRYSDCVVHCIECADDYTWIVEENCIPAKVQDFKHFLGMTFDDYCLVIQYHFESYMHSKYHRLTDEQKKYAQEIIDRIYDEDEYGFVPQVLNLMGDYQLPSGDLMRISSYGLVKRDGEPQIVIIDSGLTEWVWNEYYKR